MPARNPHSARARLLLRHPVAFISRVGRGLRRNQVLLLAGALAYNALLSIVPFFALMLLALSQFVDQEGLLNALSGAVELVIPGRTDVVVGQIRGLLEGREELGWVAIVLLLFFSASAFHVLERALERIFEHRSRVVSRHVLVSIIIPYSYMLVLGAGLTILAIGPGILGALEPHLPVTLAELLPGHRQGHWLVAVGMFVLEVVLLASFYKVMPAGRIGSGAALVGGLAAAVLWEATRRILTWYFDSISVVNIVYGSLTAVIVALLLLEVGALILLTGAQVIAEYERFVHRERFRIGWSGAESRSR
ncbi:MAG: YihY/virulence factor BrkB family protein [Gammaproteobacteria bacterium]